MTFKTALTIGGLDPTGGAGIVADIRAFAVCGVPAGAVVAAFANQTHDRGIAVWPVDSRTFIESIDAALAIRPSAIKIGMLANSEIVRVVADRLGALENCPVVLDTVMRSSSGMELLDEAGIDAMVELLFPISTVITPNWDEAAALSGYAVDSINSSVEAGIALLKSTNAVLVTGGHSEGDPVDLLFDSSGRAEFASARIDGNFRGTGCALSSLIAAELALGKGLRDAIYAAKKRLSAALDKSKPPYITF